jgi:hypothetical protein
VQDAVAGVFDDDGDELAGVAGAELHGLLVDHDPAVGLSPFNSLLIREGAMPRKRPGTIRQDHAHRATWRTVPHVPGLPAPAQQEVSQIELWTSPDWARFGLWPRAVAEALVAWSVTARDPAARQFHPCACCGRSSRAILQEALDQLSGPSATALAALVKPLDEEYKANTLPSPLAAHDRPWWNRRTGPGW